MSLVGTYSYSGSHCCYCVVVVVVHVGTSVMAVGVLCSFCELLPEDSQPTLEFIKVRRD